MKYVVGIAVNGRLSVEVEANSFDEAHDLAIDEVCDINMGELECIDWSAVNAEDENGKFVDY